MGGVVKRSILLIACLLFLVSLFFAGRLSFNSYKVYNLNADFFYVIASKDSDIGYVKTKVINATNNVVGGVYYLDKTENIGLMLEYYKAKKVYEEKIEDIKIEYYISSLISNVITTPNKSFNLQLIKRSTDNILAYPINYLGF